MARKEKLLYEGKGKQVFAVRGEPDQAVLRFKDDLTAWQGKKRGSFPGKGEICRSVSSFVFQHLKAGGVPVHWIRDLNPLESLCAKVRVIPLEAVVRNRLAGSSAKRLGFSEGAKIKAPLLEFYWKKDDLDDPFVSEEQIIQLRLIEDPAALPLIKKLSLSINKKLRPFFKEAGMELVDFKMEFGRSADGRLLLADDISPDSCRLWDLKTGRRLDKDRFRHDWGAVEEGYRSIEGRLRKKWGQPGDPA